MTRAALGDSRRARIWLRRLFPLFERMGFHVTLDHFYEPIPELRSLTDEIFERRSDLPGIDMREGEQLALLDEFVSLREEWPGPATDGVPGDEPHYHQHNLMFERVDAEVLHSMIRIRKPRRMIEIGAGHSTLLAAAAIRRSSEDDPTYRCELTSVDPNPPDFVRGLTGLDRLVERQAQDLPLDFFAELERDDILFIDSSHVVKIGSDAQFELLELVPRVAPGVLVHFHDIFFPTEYPPGFAREWHLFWNEQYVVQAFLAFNRDFAIRWSSSFIARRHEQRVARAFPSFRRGGMWPSSLWIERLTL